MMTIMFEMVKAFKVKLQAFSRVILLNTNILFTLNVKCKNHINKNHQENYQPLFNPWFINFMQDLSSLDKLKKLQNIFYIWIIFCLRNYI